MNISDAKELIKNTVEIYLEKDKHGCFVIDPSKQRPIFLLGAPGIGKTAIMEQVSQELGIPLVSYSLTHHTRQSALGLPFIKEVTYDGKEYSISEYTMSEIIASIYDVREKTGMNQGILFIDEINCVSETLYPSMLQFLQFKTFGKFKVPDDWIIVTAGNPSEFNDSAKEFDVVILDRLKKAEIKPDFKAWKDFALANNTHPAIMAFLELHKDYFYKIETTVDGKQLATARGWSDLSNIIYAYEKHFLKVDINLISQYIQHKKIAREFHSYYDVYKKYEKKYDVEKIINGKWGNDVITKLQASPFDERYALLSILLSRLNTDFNDIYVQDQTMDELLKTLKPYVMKLKSQDINIHDEIQASISRLRKEIQVKKEGNYLSKIEFLKKTETINLLEKDLTKLDPSLNGAKNFEIVKEEFNKEYKEMFDYSTKIKEYLSNSFKFVNEAFGENNEMVIFLSELSVNYYSSLFIAKYGCDEYKQYSSLLNFHDRKVKIIEDIKNNKA